MTDILSSDPGITVVGTAVDGQDALKKIKLLAPDVITLDLEMPVLDGVSVLRKVMADNPLPVIIISSHSEKESLLAIEAMREGAIDLIPKPDHGNWDEIMAQIILTVKSASNAQIPKFKILKIKAHTFRSTRKKVVVIASSTGGPQTLEALLVQLPKNIPAPILIVQHMPAGFTKQFSERLNTICEIKVKEAEEGDELSNGVALIAPGGYHMELKSINEFDEGRIHLNKEPPELGVRPCANRLFKSVAKIFRENTIGVVLTGMGSDGTEGSSEIKSFKGTIIAEAEESCIIFGMPKEVIKAGFADEVLALEKIPVALVQLLDV